MEPNFTDIVSLHSKISHVSPLEIQRLIGTFDAKMTKQMLLIYVRFFWSSAVRTKYFDEDAPCSSTHKAIINAVIRKSKDFKSTKYDKDSSFFIKLPTLLLSKCISFLKQKERVNASRINLFFMKAASTSIAKHDLFINRIDSAPPTTSTPSVHCELRTENGDIRRNTKNKRKPTTSRM